MSLARALTTRRKKPAQPVNNAYLGRAASQRAPNAKPIKREEISLPMELLSSTNALSYDAPNIPNAPNARDRSGRYFNPYSLSTTLSIGSSRNSSDDSDINTASDHSAHDTDATSVDLSSPEICNEQFFSKNAFSKSAIGTVRSVSSTASSRNSSTGAPATTEEASPKIPTRAASHTRRAHVLSHTRSVLSRERPGSSTASSPTSLRHNSFDMFSAAAMNNLASSPAPTSELPAAPTSHPFGKELEQLSEAAEEFGNAVRDADLEADDNAMRSRGLMRFCAAEYLEEIAGLSPFAGALDTNYQSMAWISKRSDQYHRVRGLAP